MRVIECATPAEVAVVAAHHVIESAPRVLGVATGATPVDTYRELVGRGGLEQATTLALLDEYIGLPADHPQRYRSVIRRQLLAPLGLPDDALLGPDVDAADLDAAAIAYEQRLVAVGGVDLQVLGIGRNGHIGFNEPGTPFDSHTRVTELTASTRADNARFFDSADEVPTRVVTQGIATVLGARALLLLAVGAAKAPAIAAMIDGPRTTDVPASALVDHPRLTIVADRAALSTVSRTAILTPHLEYR
jgi:glucosamine-6-phosphate deaminase